MGSGSVDGRGVVAVFVACLVFAVLVVAVFPADAASREAAPGIPDANLVASGARPPNILLIIADDVGVDQIGVYAEGAEPANTPNVDALAARGVLFRNTWSNPVCSSTRATIMTGRYSFRTGVGFVARRGAELRDREHTLAELLSRHPSARYATAAFGKWHLNAARTLEKDRQVLAAPHRAGFSIFRGVFKNIGESYEGWRDVSLVDRGGGFASIEVNESNTNYNSSEIVDHAATWIRNLEKRRPGDPWFVWLAFNAAHAPFHKPPEDLHSLDLTDPRLTCSNPAPFADPGNLRPCYQAMIEAMDTEIGRLLNEEIARESLDRTTVIFVGDNGTIKGVAERGRDPHHGKGTPYEGGVNVPLVIAGARVANSARGTGRESRVLVNTTDLFATVLELAGLDVSAVVPTSYATAGIAPPTLRLTGAQRESEVVLDSQSLMPQLRSPGTRSSKSTRRFAYTELFKSGEPSELWPVANAIRDTRGFKLIRILDESTGIWREEFYDLESDPLEREDLLALPATAESRRALSVLRKRMAAIEASGWRPRGAGVPGGALRKP